MNQTPCPDLQPAAVELNQLGQPFGFAVPNWKPLLRPGKQAMEARLCRIEALEAEHHAEALWNANSLDREGRNWTYLNYGPFASLTDYCSWVKTASSDNDSYFISTDPMLLDLNTIHRLLHASYWAADRTRAVVQESLVDSLCFGAYLATDGRQIGFARVVTDRSTFSWICDVIVDQPHRRKGVGKALFKAVMEHPHVRSTKCLLGTRDAHGLYESFGFVRREMMRREAPAP